MKPLPFGTPLAGERDAESLRDSSPLWLRSGSDGGSELLLHIQPGASKTEWAGIHGDALKLRVQAPPVEGAANDAVLAFIAKQFGLPLRDLRLLRGYKSQRKTVWLPLAVEEIEKRF